jgi:carboxypeptidase PM20D1
MISILEAVEKLISEGFKPDRTVYLAFGHDEEIDGFNGAKTTAASLKDRGVEAEFVLDEGMAITSGMVPMIKKNVAMIGTSEKGYLSVKLTAEMRGGHSSSPEKESAITVMNSAITNLVNNQMKAKITGPLNGFMSSIGPEMPFYARAVFANKWIFKRMLINIYKGSSAGNALVRTTTSATMFHAGIKDNIIPEKAEAVVNFRILPGETSNDVLAHISKVINDKRVIISPLDEGRSEPSPVSPAGAAGFRYISQAIQQVFPGTIVAPTMALVPSDSRHFTQLSKNIYRFAPIFVDSEVMSRIHGPNERISIADFKRGIGFYYRLLQISSSLK